MPRSWPFFTNPERPLTSKHGCANCAHTGFNPNEPAILYYIAITSDDGDTYYKIGITNFSIKERFPGSDSARIRLVKKWHFSVGSQAAKRELAILKKFSKNKYYGPRLLIGSGKGVVSVKKIKDYTWSRKSMKYYKLFSSTYLKAIKQCKKY